MGWQHSGRAMQASDLKTLHLALELPDVENGTKVQL